MSKIDPAGTIRYHDHESVPMDSMPQNSKLLRSTIYVNIVLDSLVALSLVAAYIWLFADSYNAVDGGFAIILGIPFYIVPAALVLFDGCILYRWRNNVSRKSFTYYAITRSTILLGAFYYFSQYVSYDSTFGNGYNSIYFSSLVMAALLFGLSGLIIYRAIGGAWRMALLLTVMFIVVLGSAYMHIAVGRSSSGTGSGLAGSRRDNQTARDFQLLSQDVENYALSHHRFPASLNQVLGSSDSLATEENPASRLDRYDYKYDDQTGVYKLCAAFAAVGHDPRATGFIKAYNHGKGYQCFSFTIDNWANWSAGQTPNDSTSTEGQSDQQNQGAQIYNY